MRQKPSARSSKRAWRLWLHTPKLWLGVILAVFLLTQVPKIGLRPMRENVFERQAQTTGIIRLYCFDLSRHPLASPQLPYGWGAFNMEFTPFEWLQGAVARAIHPDCESVENVAQSFALVGALLSLVSVFLLGQALVGPWTGVICAATLALDPVWLKFATYRLMDIRAIGFAFLGAWLGLKGRIAWSAVAWFIAGSHRPQAFLALALFFVVLLALDAKRRGKKSGLREMWQATRSTVVGIGAGGGVALAYHMYASYFNRTHDLPWFTWAGPRINKVYWGDWNHLQQAVFWKSQVLALLQKTGLNILLPLLLVIGAVGVFAAAKSDRLPKNWLKRQLTAILILGLPFLFARLIYTGLFYTVFMWHDYYAIPLNALGALTKGLLLGLFITEISKLRVHWRKAAVVLALLPVAIWAVGNLRFDRKQAADRANPKTEIYYEDWGVPIFSTKPGSKDLVAIVNEGPARVVTGLYLSHHPGFTWCGPSPELAPRKFWKEQGVKWVAYDRGADPTTGLTRWQTRTIEQELAHARAQGWSSDVNDYWAGHTMAEWAWFATTNGKDPCEGDGRERDPRNWGFR